MSRFVHCGIELVRAVEVRKKLVVCKDHDAAEQQNDAKLHTAPEYVPCRRTHTEHTQNDFFRHKITSDAIVRHYMRTNQAVIIGSCREKAIYMLHNIINIIWLT